MRFWWNPVQTSKGRGWLWSSVQVLCVNNPQKWRCLCLWYQSKPKWKRSLNCKIRVWGLDKFPTALPGWGCQYQRLMFIWVLRLFLIRDSIRPVHALGCQTCFVVWSCHPWLGYALLHSKDLRKILLIPLLTWSLLLSVQIAPTENSCLSRLIKSISFSLCEAHIFYSVF